MGCAAGSGKQGDKEETNDKREKLPLVRVVCSIGMRESGGGGQRAALHVRALTAVG